MKKYIAYGSNLNIEQMKRRCPSATIYGTGFLNDWALAFRSMYGPAFATIESNSGHEVPVAVWNIDKSAEMALDIYEGYPHHYFKRDIEVKMSTGESLTAMVYLMNKRSSPGLPSDNYIRTIYQGYLDNNLDISYLVKIVYELSSTSNKIYMW
ncbi:MAG: gamma-glutamylcyclotransferase family protein [Lacrimispora sphenoides]